MQQAEQLFDGSAGDFGQHRARSVATSSRRAAALGSIDSRSRRARSRIFVGSKAPCGRDHGPSGRSSTSSSAGADGRVVDRPRYAGWNRPPCSAISPSARRMPDVSATDDRRRDQSQPEIRARDAGREPRQRIHSMRARTTGVKDRRAEIAATRCQLASLCRNRSRPDSRTETPTARAFAAMMPASEQ